MGISRTRLKRIEMLVRPAQKTLCFTTWVAGMLSPGGLPPGYRLDPETAVGLGQALYSSQLKEALDVLRPASEEDLDAAGIDCEALDQDENRWIWPSRGDRLGDEDRTRLVNRLLGRRLDQGLEYEELREIADRHYEPEEEKPLRMKGTRIDDRRKISGLVEMHDALGRFEGIPSEES